MKFPTLLRASLVVTVCKCFSSGAFCHILCSSRQARGGPWQRTVCAMRVSVPNVSLAHDVIDLLGVRIAQHCLGLGILWRITHCPQESGSCIALVGWLVDSPNVGVFVEFGWRTHKRSLHLSLLGRVFFHDQWSARSGH